MDIISNFMVGLVATLHISFLILEMFYWDKPLGLKIFGHSRSQASESKTLASNQGLYNGFLAAGLIWGLMLGESGLDIIVFFLSCVIIAGIFGAVTAHRKILHVQALPGLAALILVLLA